MKTGQITREQGFSSITLGRCCEESTGALNNTLTSSGSESFRVGIRKQICQWGAHLPCSEGASVGGVEKRVQI